MQDIDKQIAAKYNVEIKSIIPYKDAFLVFTQKSKKVLRKSTLSGERILFVHGAKEHLNKNNFKCIDRYMTTVEGQPYATVEGSLYTLSDCIEGNECNFDNRNDLISASRLLARLHKASRGYVPPENSLPRDDLGKLPSFFSKRLDEIKKLKKIAKKGKSKFDYMFLDYFDYFYNLGENAIQLIDDSKYFSLVSDARSEGIFCHHDYTHHNLICSGDRISVVNFDYCCFELKVYDLANFIRRKMRKCNWDINEAKIIVNTYKSFENISEDEFFILKLMLQFPQKFWRVVNKYYNSKRSWSEKSYIVKFQEVIDEKEPHKKFMEQFELLY